MRLFIAINFNDVTRAQLLALRNELRSLSKRGNFSVTENLHLTLAFLGECDARLTDSAKSAINAVKFEPFNTVIDRIGCFKCNGGDIWWAGVQASKPLIELQGSLTDKLNDAGFAIDKRKYSPHITLGRKVITDAEPQRVEPFGETVASIELMKSERLSGRLTYARI